MLVDSGEESPFQDYRLPINQNRIKSLSLRVVDILKLFMQCRAVLYKKLSQSLRVSPEYSFDWKFLKIGSVIV